MPSKRPVALSIAGSDPSGGAGIQADLKTFHQHGVYGAAVISLLTVQNTQRVEHVEKMSANLVGAQLDAVLADLDVAAAKTGALGSAEVVEVVARRFAKRAVPLVIDPVCIATHGASLLDASARDVLLRELLPCAVLITPNAHEAEWLTGQRVRSLHEAQRAAVELLEMGVEAVLIKGGHLEEEEAIDVFADRDGSCELRSVRIANASAHGLGCALSAAIAARLARGEAVLDACRSAKRWLRSALENAPPIGHGRRPIDQFAPISNVPPEKDHAR